MSDLISAIPKTHKTQFYDLKMAQNMFYIKLKKLTFSWSKLTYLGTEGSDRKTDARFGLSGTDLPIKLHFLMKIKIF